MELNNKNSFYDHLFDLYVCLCVLGITHSVIQYDSLSFCISLGNFSLLFFLSIHPHLSPFLSLPLSIISIWFYNCSNFIPFHFEWFDCFFLSLVFLLSSYFFVYWFPFLMSNKFSISLQLVIYLNRQFHTMIFIFIIFSIYCYTSNVQCPLRPPNTITAKHYTIPLP